MMDELARKKEAKEQRRKQWVEANTNANDNKPKAPKKEDLVSVRWKQLSVEDESTTNGSQQKEVPTTDSPVPLILLTVDKPHYRSRCKETIQHLDQWQQNCSCVGQKPCCGVDVQSCDLLDLEKHPTLGVKQILFEGWRKVFLPKLLQDYSSTQPPIQFFLAAEDDIRMPNHNTPCGLVKICQETFGRYPSIEMLSLGHSWKAIQKTQKRTAKDVVNSNLLHYLQEAKGAGVHGSTLLAIRFPTGVQRLLKALNQTADEGKQTHLDHFLFYSLLHDLELALCDPPLVGWAEVDVTLTKSSSGYRRQGGGRWGFLPMKGESGDDDLVWVHRVVEERTHT